MPPQESSKLLSKLSSEEVKSTYTDLLATETSNSQNDNNNTSSMATAAAHVKQKMVIITMSFIIIIMLIGVKIINHHDRLGHAHQQQQHQQQQQKKHHLGPYKLIENQQGSDFFNYYEFYNGADSLGSAGYNTYIDKKQALQNGLINVTMDDTDNTNEEFVFIQSKHTQEIGKFRDSIRLEGKRRFDRGLFIADIRHMPAGCGIWPAFWLTDEKVWPKHGEIDIVEGINYQTVAKTALHTSAFCSMYAHVPSYAKTGVWDTATGIPDTFTGELNFDTKVEADNCWVSTPHQWANQGCVAVSTDDGTIGQPLNEKGGGVYVLEWDPDNRYIKSWVFPHDDDIPSNLQLSMETASNNNNDDKIMPDPNSWNVLPYAYFAIGEETGCSADHFQNMRLIFNLAFCGTVAGNRFFTDCPVQAKLFNIDNDPIQSCNAYMDTNPQEVQKDAYWKIRGVYIYERT